jgi:hypothetical protein
MIKIVNSLELQELRKLPTFEDKCFYWNEHFEFSFFQVVGADKDTTYRLPEDIENGKDKETLIRYEIKRVTTLDPNVLLIDKRLRMMDQLNRSVNLKLTKEKLLKELASGRDLWSEEQKIGYVTYEGLIEESDLVKAFATHLDFSYAEGKTIILSMAQRRMKDFVRGYKIKALVDEINDYPSANKVFLGDSTVPETGNRNPTLSPTNPKGKLHAPSLTETETAMLGYAMRDKKLIAGSYNLSLKNLSFGLCEMTGYAQKQLNKKLVGKKSITDFHNDNDLDIVFIEKLKLFVDELENKIKHN